MTDHPVFARSDLPRQPDGYPPAWEQVGETPSEVWERCSPAYEAQAMVLLDALARRGMAGTLEHAGSEDGETLLVTVPGEEGALYLFQLEDPEEARYIADAIASGGVEDLLDGALG